MVGGTPAQFGWLDHRLMRVTVAQMAHATALDARTVRRWLDEPRFRPRLCGARPGKLDPY